ncbi:hypothetical protein KGP36_02260 [Patescibacteria group bacterium]|nr:hypothetical protein [Patescibacteria group bacterium]
MAKMHRTTRSNGTKPGYGMDKGFAPAFRGQPAVGDGQNINIPVDALGFAVEAQVVENPLRTRGNVNYPGPFRDVVGGDSGAALKGRNGFADGNGGGRGVGRDSGLDEKAEDPGEEPDEESDLD